MKRIQSFLLIFLASVSLVLAAEGDMQKALFTKVYFMTGSAKLNSEADNAVEKLAQFLKDNPDSKVEIAGHTDHRGSYKYNQKLSWARATQVKKHLISQGIESDRIILKWFSYSKPAVYKAKSGKQLALNRRVELYTYQKVAAPEQMPPDYVIIKIEPEKEVVEATEPPPENVQDFKIVYNDKDNFDAVVFYECDKITTYYGDWEQGNCNPKKKNGENAPVNPANNTPATGSNTTPAAQ